ncbi:uncharacterized protein LOC122957778 [Acropora millepora]|uniref:uncharacterized protein LOC122957778 n=1 Tax=Acropora millepora TaxID=45264 RepID=UPI001CF27A99|nr:uncharacterized protein LOC122957778 [Acropora millepora]
MKQSAPFFLHSRAKVRVVWGSIFPVNMSNLELLCAGFSAILGTNIVPEKNGAEVSIHDLFQKTYVMRPPSSVRAAGEFHVFVKDIIVTGKTITIKVTEKSTVDDMKIAIQDQTGRSHKEIRLTFSGKQLEDGGTVKNYGLQHGDTVYLIPRLLGGSLPLPRALNTNELDPDFDYDFTNVKDDGERYMRGGFEYKRPYGWNRIAVKVVGKYQNDDWLGPNGIRTGEAPGEWPVSYHGTNMSSANMILREGYKPGPRALYGKGIYTSPNLEMVQRLYAQEFTHGGKTYKIVLQNRVNPDRRNGHLEIIPASKTGVGADYWLSPAYDKDVRPYGVLIREVPKSTSQ